MSKIIAYVKTDMCGSKVESAYDIPEDWDEMSEGEKEDYLIELASEHALNHGEFGAYVH